MILGLWLTMIRAAIRAETPPAGSAVDGTRWQDSIRKLVEYKLVCRSNVTHAYGTPLPGLDLSTDALHAMAAAHSAACGASTAAAAPGAITSSAFPLGPCGVVACLDLSFISLFQ